MGDIQGVEGLQGMSAAQGRRQIMIAHQKQGRDAGA